MAGGSLLDRIKRALTHGQFLRREAIALPRARLIIANSERTKRDIIRCYGIDESIIHTIYYGIDPTKFYPAAEEERRRIRQQLGFSPDKHLIVFIGALGDRRKGFDTLFEAWEILGSERTNVELVVIGSGSDLPSWRKRATELPGHKAIHFLGFRRDIPAILRACDALVAPTRYEPFGLAVLEALCCGLPAIVSRDAGVAEIYPENLDGLLLNDPESAAELAEKMRSVISGSNGWSGPLLSVSDKLRHYTWDDMAAKIFALMQ
jgi:glycosyltransferase involved in cell wall biosynthesis